ncbi:MAG: ATP-binding cassette domain-containing protein, partial [Gammaproteobacteria bacterium]|nr:ATP-binding cassette domain-containing protein [Gammaproteobacteria bacterium]
MIRLDAISLQRGSKFLLDSASATLYPGQKIALIGANGSGKSSLFQLLLGQLQCDQGNVKIPADWRIAHMAQEVETSERAAIDYVLDGDQRLRQLQAALASAEQRLEQDNNSSSAMELATLHEQLDDIDGYNANVRAEQLLQGLGFASSDAARPANSFSGGWRIRLNLAQALMSPSELLLLDEPTNHLDL